MQALEASTIMSCDRNFDDLFLKFHRCKMVNTISAGIPEYDQFCATLKVGDLTSHSGDISCVFMNNTLEIYEADLRLLTSAETEKSNIGIVLWVHDL